MYGGDKMNSKEMFTIKIIEISRKNNIGINSFNEVIEIFNNVYDILDSKETELLNLQNELDRTKINMNIQNKEIAVKLVEIRQNGINKCYDECLSEHGVITLYKEYLEKLNQ